MSNQRAVIWLRGPIIAALLLSGCGPTVGTSTGVLPPSDGTSSDATKNIQYVIGAGDVLGISVYHAPELSVPSIPVRPDGRISMPLIPDIVAAGKTPKDLAREIEKRLTKFIQDPNVTVIVRSFIGPADRQVRVIGEASDPIAIPYREHMTLLDVMISTKGLTKYAAGNRAVIIRLGVDGKRKSIGVKLSDLIKDGDISQNVEMQPGDTLIIPQSWF